MTSCSMACAECTQYEAAFVKTSSVTQAQRGTRRVGEQGAMTGEMPLYTMRPRYLPTGGGLMRFDLQAPADDLEDSWWDGQELAALTRLNADYRYKKVPPLVVSTGSLIHLYRHEVVDIIMAYERQCQIIEFSVYNKSGKVYDYYAVKTLRHLEILHDQHSRFGTDGTPKKLVFVQSVPQDRHYFRITGIENYVCISSELAERIQDINDGSINVQEVPVWIEDL